MSGAGAMLRGLVAAMTMALLLTGCGQTVPGTAQRERRDLDTITVFNPCRGELPDDALRSAGLDPATMRVLTDPPQGVSTWRVCSWEPLDEQRFGTAALRVHLWSHSHLLGDAAKREENIVLRPTRVNGRQGLVTKEKSAPESCYVVFEAQQGMFDVSAGWVHSEGTRPGDTCEHAQYFADRLEPHLPK